MIDPALTIMVEYSCPPCGLLKISCPVPTRGEEDVLAWMDKMIHVLTADHHRRSPRCHPESLKDITIPMSGREKIGGPTLQ